MTDSNNVPVVDKGDTGMVVIVYWLYLAGFLTGGITSVIGVIMAYVSQGDAPPWLRTHYRFQIRPFWLLFLFTVISGLLTVIFIGILTGLLASIWFIVRCVKGMAWAQAGQEVPDPASWMLGEAKK